MRRAECQVESGYQRGVARAPWATSVRRRLQPQQVRPCRRLRRRSGPARRRATVTRPRLRRRARRRFGCSPCPTAALPRVHPRRSSSATMRRSLPERRASARGCPRPAPTRDHASPLDPRRPSQPAQPREGEERRASASIIGWGRATSAPRASTFTWTRRGKGTLGSSGSTGGRCSRSSSFLHQTRGGGGAASSDCGLRAVGDARCNASRRVAGPPRLRPPTDTRRARRLRRSCARPPNAPTHTARAECTITLCVRCRSF